MQAAHSAPVVGAQPAAAPKGELGSATPRQPPPPPKTRPRGPTGARSPQSTAVPTPVTPPKTAPPAQPGCSSSGTLHRSEAAAKGREDTGPPPRVPMARQPRLTQQFHRRAAPPGVALQGDLLVRRQSTPQPQPHRSWPLTPARRTLFQGDCRTRNPCSYLCRRSTPSTQGGAASPLGRSPRLLHGTCRRLGLSRFRSAWEPLAFLRWLFRTSRKPKHFSTRDYPNRSSLPVCVLFGACAVMAVMFPFQSVNLAHTCFLQGTSVCVWNTPADKGDGLHTRSSCCVEAAGCGPHTSYGRGYHSA